MMGQKHLHELLKEEQEPFQLHHYIAHRRSHYHSSSSFSSLQVQPNKFSKHIIKESSSSKLSFCKQACFLSFRDSPDPKKSPFPSPAKSPASSTNIFLHIPTKTAAMLLEAAIKIHQHSSKPKPKSKSISLGFGLFGSFFKRLKNKTKNGSTNSPKNYLLVFGNKKSQKISDKNEKICINYENSRVSSAGWSESNEGTTSRSDYTEEFDFASFDKQFCLSPSSPFHFALDNGRRHTPEISSPAKSPICHKQEDNHLEEERLQKIEVEHEEEKDRCSPVSIFDPPFEDDDDDDDEPDSGDEMDEEDNDFEVECSYANVQRAKLQLLHKLRRFEKLAELDPVELEKRMLEDDDEDTLEEEECNYVDESRLLYMEENLDEVVGELLSRSNQCQIDKIPADVRRLLLDLIAEEQKSGMDCTCEAIVSRVCKRLKAWKEVESNTIDMMVESDFRKEVDEWKRYQEEVGDRAREIEVSIFGLLVEELVS